MTWEIHHTITIQRDKTIMTKNTCVYAHAHSGRWRKFFFKWNVKLEILYAELTALDYAHAHTRYASICMYLLYGMIKTDYILLASISIYLSLCFKFFIFFLCFIYQFIKFQVTHKLWSHQDRHTCNAFNGNLSQSYLLCY